MQKTRTKKLYPFRNKKQKKTGPITFYREMRVSCPFYLVVRVSTDQFLKKMRPLYLYGHRGSK